MAEPAESSRPATPGAFWSGVVTFGLVSIPVELVTAVRSSRPSLRMLGPDGLPVRRRYVRQTDERPLEDTEIVRGFEVEEGAFVTVTEEELEALEPERSREIDLRRFVPRSSLDPRFLDRPYFLLPDGEVNKAYRLLARILEDTGQAGVASFVLRGREVLIAIFAERGILRAETLRHEDEVRSPADVGLEAPPPADPATVASMRAEIEGQAADALDPGELVDVRGEQLRALARRRPEGELVHVPEAAREAADEAGEGRVVDIMDVLRARLAG